MITEICFILNHSNTDETLPTHLFDGLPDSNLVVDGHHRHQRGVRTDGGLEQLNTHRHTHAVL